MMDIARLYLSLKSLSPQTVTAKEIKAIERMVETSEDGRDKYGLKLTLNAIVQRTMTSIMKQRNFNWYIHFVHNQMFSTARYQCISSSVDTNRRPEQLPQENEMKLKTFISDQIKLVKDTFKIYVCLTEVSDGLPAHII
ncbi:hypothetical protein ACJMK2_022967 [Sinanodonta woodiana]|uniref:Uncharacterized protein n=1 Tax=Sinanodonta woodiana TaxID=1069815 RepID=A0ABD3TKL8_SINWO